MSGLEGLGIVANVIAVVDLSLKVISWCSKYAQDVKSSHDGRARLLQAAITLHYESEKIHDLLSRKGSKLQASQRLDSVIGSSRIQLCELESQLSQKGNRSNLKWPMQKEKVEIAIQNIEKTTKTMLEMLQIDMADILVTIDDRAEAEEQRATIDRLPYVIDAVWNSHTEGRNAKCLPNTRERLLEEVDAWIRDTTQESKTVFWLNGMAGTGKSTISRTISQHASQNGCLGATFFFKRGEADRGGISKLVPTIARQLAMNQPILRPYVHAAVLDDPFIIASDSVTKQFNALVSGPLMKSSGDLSSKSSIAIVIDALDECEREEDVRLILSLLSTIKTTHGPRPRVFVTSRPDLPVRLGFKNIEGSYRDLILHDISASVIKQDISIFFLHKMELIQQDWNKSVVEESRKLPQDWPGIESIQLLTEKAVPLFIVAATAYRFIKARNLGDPVTQLSRFLEYETEDTVGQLDSTYRPVLAPLFSSAYSKNIEDRVILEFRRVVGTIINLFDPLSTLAISRLLDVGQNIIYNKLDLLHSVLDVPPSSDAPVRMLHLSFRDYLMSPAAEKHQFWIDEKKSARNLAKDCLRVMETLQPNICRLKIPGTHRSTLKPEFINACMPPEAQYACLYWVNHQVVAGLGPGDATRILKFLKQHLLHWFEAMSLLGRAFQISGLMRELHSVIPIEHTDDISKLIDFINDAIRFVDIDIQTLNFAPLQIYCSFLVLAPSNSIVRQTFAAKVPAWLTLLSGHATTWDSRLHVLGNANDLIFGSYTVFSPDSKLLCFISENGHLHVWSCDTGECIHDIEPEAKSYPLTTEHKSRKAPVFKFSNLKMSPNGKLVAVILQKYCLGEILIFDLTTGQVHCKVSDLESLSGITFSQDSKFIWSYTMHRKLCIWDLSAGTCIEELDCPVDMGSAVILSSFEDPKAAILESYCDGTYVWYLDSSKVDKDHTLLWTAEPRFRGRNVSPDGRLLAVRSSDGPSLIIWDISRRKLLWRLSTVMKQYHDQCIAFSSDSNFLANGVDYGPIQLWDMRDGKCFKTFILADDNKLESIKFHPDTRYLISTHAVDDGTKTWLWEINTGTYSVIDIGPSYMDTYLPFSPDGKTMTSRNSNNTIQLWDWQRLLAVPPGAVSEIRSLSFSLDLSMIMSLSDGGEIVIWDTATGARLYSFSCPPAYSVEFSPDSSLIATTSGLETAKVWNLHEPDFEWQLHQKGLMVDLMFSPDSQVIATLGAEIKIWVRESGTFRFKALLSSQKEAKDICFSRDAKLVAVSSTGRVKIWNCETGQLVQSLPFTRWHLFLLIDVRPSTVLSYSIVVIFHDSFEVWDLETCSCIFKGGLKPHLYYQIVSSRGTFTLSSSIDQLKIWDWSTGETLTICPLSFGIGELQDFFPESSIVCTTLGHWVLSSEPGHSRQLTQIFGFEPKCEWVQWKGHNLFKLPPDLSIKGIKVAVIPGESLGFIVATWSSQRGVVILRFSNEGGMLDDLISR